MRASANVQKESPEFLDCLFNGGELLSQGKVIEAKEHLEKAHQLHPKSEKAQNLLGLAYFKLGLFERAAEIYELLVRENPADPTLRVNLGLVYLKASALDKAKRAFETATDLSPEHKKAQNYLGLVLAQLGEYEKAKEHFVLAGSDAMVEKMTRVLAGEPYAEAAAETPPQEAKPSEASPGEEVEVEVDGEEDGEAAPLSKQDWGAQFGLEASSLDGVFSALEKVSEPVAEEPPEPEPQPEPEPEREMEPEAEPLPSLAEAPAALTAPLEMDEGDPAEDGAFVEGAEAALESAQSAEVAVASPLPLLSELGPALQKFSASPLGTFEVLPKAVAIRVQGELFTRTAQLLVVTGKLELRPEPRRISGKSTDQPFGDGKQQLVCARGTGTLWIEMAEGSAFDTFELGGGAAHFREERVFAFEPSVAFENGRLIAPSLPGMDTVSLSGRGNVLLAHSGTLQSMLVRIQKPVTVPLTNVMGWYGNVTARLVSMVLAPGPIVPAVEITGEGFALFTAPLG